MIIPFNLSSVFGATDSRLENAEVLRALLDCLIATDVSYLAHHQAPRLYGARVRYLRTIEWERIPDVILRGGGDCKSLAAWRIAELRHDGHKAEPEFRFNPRPSSGVPDFHILVMTENGHEDPSRILGMNKDENSYMEGR